MMEDPLKFSFDGALVPVAEFAQSWPKDYDALCEILSLKDL